MMVSRARTTLAHGQMRDWVRRNLFNSWYNSILTVVLGLVAIYVSYRAGRFVFITGQWDAVRVNLTLFMMGTFDRSEQWRLVAHAYLFASAVGIAWGAATAGASDRADDAGMSAPRPRPLDLLRRYWSLLLLAAALL